MKSSHAKNKEKKIEQGIRSFRLKTEPRV